MKIGMMSYPCGKYEQITPSKKNHVQVRHWYGNSSMYESNLIIKFDKILFNFVCRAVVAFVSARPGHNVKTRGYDDQGRDLGSEGPLA